MAGFNGPTMDKQEKWEEANKTGLYYEVAVAM
jgi:hypothetical protein